MTKREELLAAALSYAARGWLIFPCAPGTKIPHKGTAGVKDASNDPETIKKWWSRWPDSNIALACGPVSGVHVVDVDLDLEKNVDGWETLKGLPELPITVKQNTPRGGTHLFYKTDTPPLNQNSFKPGIDIRSEGFYVMLAPSIHPNGKAYEWDSSCGPDQVELAEFPDFMRPQKAVHTPPWAKSTSKKAARPAPSPQAPSVLERARLYLRECEPATQGQAGHSKLLWAARAMVVGFELSESDAASLLWDEFNPRCNPPWDHSKASDAKDFERKITEACRTGGTNPRGWLLDECGLRGNDEALLTFGRKLADNLTADRTAPAPVQEETASPMPEFMTEKRSKNTSIFPEWVLHPTGLVGELCEYINQTAGCYQPMLALACSITACGALFGRKVRDQSNGRTNIYMMGVAHSSAGKDHPADCIEQIFSKAGASALLGGSRVTSDSAIEVALQACPVQLFNWDEVGHMFAAIKQAGVGSGGAQHLRTIVPALMQLYSSAHKLYIGKQRAEEDVRRVDQPHVCVWGLTSPDVLYAGLSTSELRDGWLGRVITIISHDRPKYQIKQHVAPPEHLINQIQAWLTRHIPPPEGTGDVAGSTGCYQIEIPTSPLALKVFEAFRDECYNRMIRCDETGDDSQYLWGKGLQNARRIALIMAAGDRFDNQEITEHHAKYGCELIRKGTETFSASIKNNLSDNNWEADKQGILKIITRAGQKGISKMELTKRTQTIRDRKVRDSYIADMVEAGLINFAPNPAHPEARAGWLWVHPFGLASAT